MSFLWTMMSSHLNKATNTSKKPALPVATSRMYCVGSHHGRGAEAADDLGRLTHEALGRGIAVGHGSSGRKQACGFELLVRSSGTPTDSRVGPTGDGARPPSKRSNSRLGSHHERRHCNGGP